MNPRRLPPPFLDERKALACVHCGLCLSSCPTYLETGDENDSPRGRIYLMRALQAGRLAVNRSTLQHLDTCLGCRACETACPSGVHYGELIEGTRDYLAHHPHRGLLDRIVRRWLIEGIFPHPRRLRLALMPARMIRAARIERFLPGRLRELIDLIPSADFDAPVVGSSDDAETGSERKRAKSWDRRRLPEFSPAIGAHHRGRVGLVTGCVMDVLYRRTHWNTVRLLNTAGYDVLAPREQVCCGALHAHGGNISGAVEAACQNVKVFTNLDLDAIVTNAAGCGSTLKEYGRLLARDPVMALPASGFAAKVRDLTEILSESTTFLEVLALARCHRQHGLARVACHDACHLAHAQRVTEAPRRLIRAVAGDALVDLPEAEICCGSAGSYNLTQPEMARQLQRRKVQNIATLGPVTVITTNPGCLLQIKAGIRSAGIGNVTIEHIADWLAARLKTDEPTS